MSCVSFYLFFSRFKTNLEKPKERRVCSVSDCPFSSVQRRAESLAKASAQRRNQKHFLPPHLADFHTQPPPQLLGDISFCSFPAVPTTYWPSLVSL